MNIRPESFSPDPSEVMHSRLLHESAATEAKFRGMLEVAPDAIITVNRDGVIVLVNGQAEALFGYSRQELLGEPIEILLPERYRGLHSAHRNGYAKAPRIRPMGANLDLYARRKDGTEFPVEISLGPVESDGELLVMTAIRDITDRKLVEAELRAARQKAEEADTAKSEFLSRMSHELRTPLNAILGFGQLLATEPLNDEQRDGVEHILRAGHHLLELINEVLDISRIEAGRLSLSLEPVPVDELLRETQDLVRPPAQSHNVILLSEAGASGLHMLADRQRLRQVLLNLLTNAVKYNHRGGEARILVSRRPAGAIRISVSDTGPGISPELQARLFLPFERLGAEQTGVEGTGLGLALSKRLVEVMDGSLNVESEPGRGSTFAVDLPAADSVAGLAQSLPQGSLSDMLPRSEAARSVLYIEDNIDSYQLMERIFSHWPGVKLLAAMQGRLGVELAQQHHPDLVLLDLHLPDIGGQEVLERLRADATTRDIPIIVTSADATPGQIERLLSAGADEYLTKPLDIPRFAEAVRKRLE